VSNSIAIAAVTTAVRYVLERALTGGPGPVGGANVTTVRPDRVTAIAEGDNPAAGINVFCYHVSPNHAWNLSDLPTRHSDGALARRPVAALDLHYVLTGYGVDGTLDAERLLARAVLALAATPVLTRDVVTAALDLYSADDGMAFLAESDLGDQIEQVKLSPAPLSLEEVSKLWGVFSTPYRLSVTYDASVVLLEASQTPRTALPVLARTVTVSAAGSPRIAEVTGLDAGGGVTTGGTLEILGTGLRGVRTQVRAGRTALELDDEATPQRLTVVVPATVAAGVRSLQVVHRTMPPEGPERVAAVSNAVPLLVRPTVTVAPPSDDVDDVTVTVAPPVLPEQRVTITLRRLSGGDPDEPGHRMVDLPPAGHGEPARETFLLPRGSVGPGRWLVRVSVDGVESMPELDGETYGSPSVTLL
jgi:hypothetical protein